VTGAVAIGADAARGHEETLRGCAEELRDELVVEGEAGRAVAEGEGREREPLGRDAGFEVHGAVAALAQPAAEGRVGPAQPGVAAGHEGTGGPLLI